MELHLLAQLEVETRTEPARCSWFLAGSMIALPFVAFPSLVFILLYWAHRLSLVLILVAILGFVVSMSGPVAVAEVAGDVLEILHALPVVQDELLVLQVSLLNLV